MTQEEIKRKRAESILKEVIPEALSSLSDERINSLSITEVVCSKGRDDAKVYLEKQYFTPSEQNEVLKQLKKASSYIRGHISRSEGWFRAPKLTFIFDDHYEKVSRMEELFAKIAQQRGEDGKNSA